MRFNLSDAGYITSVESEVKFSSDVSADDVSKDLVDKMRPIVLHHFPSLIKVVRRFSGRKII